MRGDGAPRGATFFRALRGAGASGEDALAPRRSTCGFSVPGAVLPGGRPAKALGLCRPGRLPPPVAPAHVQPLKADPPSGAGRLAGASREWITNPPAGAASTEPHFRGSRSEPRGCRISGTRLSAAPPSGSSLEDAPRRAGHGQDKGAQTSGDKFFLRTVFYRGGKRITASRCLGVARTTANAQNKSPAASGGALRYADTAAVRSPSSSPWRRGRPPSWRP